MGLKKKTISGIIWSFGSQGGKQVSQFIITAVLARLLSPKDFGLLGMATVFTGFVTLFAELGVSGALIQKQNVDDNHLSSAFWLNIVVGIILTLIFIALAPLIAGFYNKPELKPILIVLSFNFVLSSFTVIQQTILTKDMDFRALAVRDVTAVIISGIVGIYLAYNGHGVWSLVYQLLTFTFVNGFLLWILSKWRPKFIFSITAIKDIFHFSANMTGFNILGYFSGNIDYLLIGRFLGSESLGYYTLAYKLMMVPLRNVTAVISKVMFPVFSQIQNDLEKVCKTYLKMIKAIAFITVPAMFGLFVIAPEFINIIYGPKWSPVIGLVKIFCFCGIAQSIGGTVVNIRLSQGKAGLQFKIGMLNTFFATILISIGLKWGIYGVTFFYTVFSIIWSCYTVYITLPLIKMKLSTFIANLYMPFTTSLFLLFILLLIKRYILLSQLLTLIILPLIGIIVYVISLVYLKQIRIKDKKIVFP